MTNKEKKDDKQIIAHLDDLTKQGQRFIVLREISHRLKEDLSPSLRADLARLANRNHAYVLALRILHPLIRNDREKISEASSEVLNIYATSLMWIGALEEAQECLHRIKGSTEALLTKVFVYFAQWEYQKSIPVLLKYLSSNLITPYQRLVGRINLLAAFIAIGNLDKAKNVFEPLILELKINPNFRLLYGNCMELRAQIEILNMSYKTALSYLLDAEKSLSDQPGRYLLYVNKWRAIAKLGLDPQSPEAVKELQSVKAEAIQLRNWETIRDCDFQLARLKNDRDLLRRILLGTPYLGYHKRVKSIFNISLDESKHLDYCPGQILIKPERIGLDLNTLSDNSFFNSTSWPLLQALTRDIYRPPRMGVVFTALYGQEYFDPFTSPQRVRNSVFRFNEWSKNQACEFNIKVLHGDFHLVGPQNVGIVNVQRKRTLKGWQATLKSFKDQNQSRSFTSFELAQVLGISQRSALNILHKGLNARKVQKLGRGKNSRYIFYSGRRAA